MTSWIPTISAITLAIAGLAVWALSSTLTPYVSSPATSECLLTARQATSMVGWFAGIFVISTAIAMQRGAIRATGKVMAITFAGILFVSAGSSTWLMYVKQMICPGL